MSRLGQLIVQVRAITGQESLHTVLGVRALIKNGSIQRDGDVNEKLDKASIACHWPRPIIEGNDEPILK
jgi:hypothetical protein